VTTTGTRRRRVPPRQLLARHLEGSGIEVGPGHHPFALSLPGVDVTYVDRWRADESSALFPQLAAETGFVEPDVLADFNTDRLSPIADASQDFVIASHVLEHLAEPIGFLAEMHRVLRPGGVALILLPDRHRTRDRERRPTPLAHLISEYREGVDEVSDEHLLDWLTHRGLPIGDTAEERLATLDRYRRRSIHVHCWNAAEFLEVIVWAIEHLDQRWEFVDGSLPIDEFPPGIEFGYVLRRSAAAIDPATRRRRFQEAWRLWHESRLTTTVPRARVWSYRLYRTTRQKVGARLRALLPTQSASSRR
jgi:SAM-dependent methyltransferase